MKSDLANALKNIPLPDQDDAFLVTHLLAGAHEIGELDALLAKLAARRAEAAAIKTEIERTLCARHTAGRNFAALGSLVRILPPAAAGKKGAAASVEIERVEIVQIAEVQPA